MYTIVIADDEKMIRKALIHKVNWEKIGFKIIGEAENGAEALELVEKLKPDLLVTDIKMPFISGIELARQVRQIRPMTQIAFLSGYDEFTFAQQAIQYNIISYLLKPITSEKFTEELIRIREKMEKKYQEFLVSDVMQEKISESQFLMTLLLDSYASKNIVHKSDEYEASMLKNAVSSGLIDVQSPELLKYVVLVTFITDKDGKNCTSVMNINALNNIFSKYMRHSSVFVQNKVVTLLMGTEKEINKYLTIAVDDVTQSINRIIGYNTAIGVSRTVSKLTDVHECYKDAMNALSGSSKKDSSIHFISDEDKMGTFNHINLNEVEELIRGGDESAIKEYLNDFFEKIKSKTIAQASADYTKILMVATVLRVIYAIAGDEATQLLQKESVMRSFSEVSGLNNEKEQYIDLFLKAKGMIKEQRQRSSEVNCRHAISIINQRYMDPDLSLRDVSDEIGISPNYLSSLIKKMKGINFSQLLIQKRMEVAEELLSCTGMKILEISKKCGYSEPQYFSYCFKKYTGKSPNTYRKKYE